LYGLERVAKNIEDKTGNVTRFLVLGKEEVAPSGKDKTSLLVVLIFKR
jgi:chorismate mutase/prephenate dehydratase